MEIVERAYRGAEDRDRIRRLALSAPDLNLHTVDLPYRLCSPAFDAAVNVRLWEDKDGHLLAAAIWQAPFKMLDSILGTKAWDLGLPQRILEWVAPTSNLSPKNRGGEPSPGLSLRQGEENSDCAPSPSQGEGRGRGAPSPRSRGEGRERGPAAEGITVWSKAREDNAAWISLLEAAGFVWHGGSMAHTIQSLERDLPEAKLPPGFTIRPLKGGCEGEAYVALHRATFRSQSMTVSWRQRTLAMPHYRPELDMVVAAPDGQLVAFCVCWTVEGAKGLECQIEPFGVHPDFRGQGLGRALLQETLRRMQDYGVKTALVETWNDNPAALSLYRSVGFEVTHNVRAYGKTFGEKTL